MGLVCRRQGNSLVLGQRSHIGSVQYVVTARDVDAQLGLWELGDEWQFTLSRKAPPVPQWRPLLSRAMCT
jgi:hypothetical protein